VILPGELRRAKEPFDFYPFVVAELGANHNQDLDLALATVTAAAAAGADAIKVQTYTPEGMIYPGTRHRIEGGQWDGEDLYDLYRRGALPWSWHQALFTQARERGILAFASVFEPDAVPFLERLGCPMYKIASCEILDLDLIRVAAATRKPMVISTGMATLAEIDEAVAAATSALDTNQITLLKCTAAYPAPAAEANLETLNNLREHYGCKVGLSDHTRGSTVAIAAALYGVDMIEKHFTLDRAAGGLDAEFSAEPADLRDMIDAVHAAMDAIGEERFGPTESERSTYALRRTLHVIRAMKAGEPFSGHNVRPLRPADGLPPRELHHFLGVAAARDIAPGEPLTWELLRKPDPRPPGSIA